MYINDNKWFYWFSLLVSLNVMQILISRFSIFCIGTIQDSKKKKNAIYHLGMHGIWFLAQYQIFGMDFKWKFGNVLFH